ncbi:MULTISPECIES: hypothetical protein [Bifidobacterium]|uniref:hypothetical protein n=1 Tax=Bifidobacterium TaxID=1678 RepID=UPI001BDBBB36|nr:MULTISPECIES: hypothetical protein [Bifidobacterium]MBT1161572.1 hypothetical protein [Bifidobacterium sp. SO1]MBW3078948.1 hypothetical protein [Bifidobacterium simiiventris]
MERVGRFLTRVGAAFVAFAVSLAMLCAGGSGATAPAGTTTLAVSRYLGHDVYAALDGMRANDGGVYLSNGDSSAASTDVRRVSAASEALPWTIRVTYSLDGPQTDADGVNGASGLVGVRVTVTRNELASHDIVQAATGLVPVVAFTIPTEVGDDLSSSDGAVITQQGSDNVITAIGDDVSLLGPDDSDWLDDMLHAAQPAGSSGDTILDLSVYLNAKQFSMSPIVLAALPASDANDITAQAADLAQSATSLADTLTGAASQSNDDLIAQLTALRDQERALASSTIAERTAAHRQAFDAYMASYVGSYTTHLSGSISNKTQMAALIGTAGELSGDTPLAQAVVDLANAVNAVSAAHRHTGAADEVDAIIRRIRQQGVSGLADELTQNAGRESQLGSSGYSAGQSQLSQAMIPYSMAYTDTYTEHLSELTGGTSSGAAAYQQQAITETNESFKTETDLKADQAKVDAAMAALATASEHTGRAQAIRQLLLRFEDRFESGDGEAGSSDSAAAATATKSGEQSLESLSATDSPKLGVGGNGIAAVVEAARLKRLHAERERAAAAAQAQSQQTDGQAASLVDDQVSMSKSDVMSFAGSVTSLGGGTKDAGSGTADDASSGNGTTDASATTSSKEQESLGLNEAPSVAFGIRGMNPGSLLTPNNSPTIDETVAIGDAAGILPSAVSALADAGSLNDLADHTSDQSSGTRFLLVVETLS